MIPVDREFLKEKIEESRRECAKCGHILVLLAAVGASALFGFAMWVAVMWFGLG